MKTELMKRDFFCELRAEEAENLKKIFGKPIVFGKEAVIGDSWREVMMAGCLDEADLSDVLLLVNHDDRKIPLARSRASKKTMEISVDETGLSFTATLDTESNAEAKAVYSAIERGDVTGMSFAFRVAPDGDDWIFEENNELPLRVIKKIEVVHEISIVSKPAYKDTYVFTRSESEGLEAVRELTKKKAESELEMAKLKALALI